MLPFFLYILKCRDGSYYIGHTDNIEKRMSEHNQGIGNSYTSNLLPVEVVYIEQFASRVDALEAERKLKKWTREKKEILIKEGWEGLKSFKKRKKLTHSTSFDSFFDSPTVRSEVAQDERGGDEFIAKEVRESSSNIKEFDLKAEILSFIKKNNLIIPGSRIIVGLSGGPDSTFLLYILKELQEEFALDLIAAHLDHGWRENSYLDIDFCKELTNKLNVKFVYAKAKELDFKPKNKGSKEDLGRQMRRYFFAKVAQEYNAKSITLAHHLQDQQETFFIRLIRGTTLSGLVSMKPIDGIYIRPLLEINKSDILQYLQENKISYLVDPTNFSQEFLRNRIRSNVLTALQACDNRFDSNFLRTLNHLKDTENFLQKLVEEKFNEIAKKTDNDFELNLEQLLALDKFLQKKVIFYWLYKSGVSFELTERFIEEIIRFLQKPGNSTHNIHFQWKIQKNKNLAIVIKIH